MTEPSRCARHVDLASVGTCPRCGAFVCLRCGPREPGQFCMTCDGAAPVVAQRIRRSTRWVVTALFAMVALDIFEAVASIREGAPVLGVAMAFSVVVTPTIALALIQLNASHLWSAWIAVSLMIGILVVGPTWSVWRGTLFGVVVVMLLAHRAIARAKRAARAAASQE